VTTAALPEPLVARTVAVPDPGPLLARLPERGPLSWVRGGKGLVAWGEVARYDVRGPDRFERADAWWRELADTVEVEDEVAVPGTGPVAFASFAFADSPTPSLLVVPRTVLGVRDGTAWLTTLGPPSPPVPVGAPRAPGPVSWSPGATTPERWHENVRWVTNAIARGDLDKAVLALDEVARAAQPLDPRWVLGRLAERYPSCWTFAVEGLVGATPELLVRRLGMVADSRVLAGTARRGSDAGLLESGKDRAEHDYAVDSLVAGFSAHCKNIRPSEPYLLELANVTHLATDVRARVADGASLLTLAGSLHPTAAVGGTPTRTALHVIARLEPADRGRYAGPVGWVDAAGDGELGLALRCAQLEGPTARLWAGCGIVADSDWAGELAEAQAKLEPVRTALGG
jgi:menaquinone-specific isochorismate synthase